MAIIAKGSSGEFTPAPEGLHPAVCVDVVDLGLQETPWGPKHKVDLIWQIEEENAKTKRPFEVRQRYTLTLSQNNAGQPSKLRAHLEAWRGRKFTTKELEGFDIETLIGIGCQIQVVHNIAENGKTYANIQAVVKLGKGMTAPAAREYVRVQDRPKQQGNGGQEAPEPDEEGAGGGGDGDEIPF